MAELFRFIDWVIDLPEKLEIKFEKAVREMEKADKMRYVTTIERRAKKAGIQEGLEQGLEQGRLETAGKMCLKFLPFVFSLSRRKSMPNLHPWLI